MQYRQYDDIDIPHVTNKRIIVDELEVIEINLAQALGDNVATDLE